MARIAEDENRHVCPWTTRVRVRIPKYMKTAIALLLAGCSTVTFVPPADGGLPPTDDASTRVDSGQEADAGTDSSVSTRVDSGPGPEVDAGSDAGTPEPMLDGGSDSGPIFVEEDAGTTVEPDAGSPVPDAGPPEVDAGSPPDGGPPPALDAGPPPCEADGFEPNDARTDAPVVSTMTASSDEVGLDLTWTPGGDPADWVALETRRGLNTIRLTGYDSDAYSHVTVRVRCLSGLVWCRGVRATSPQPDSCEVTGATGVALVDVACFGDGAADAWVGVVPPTPEPRCAHHLRVVVEPVP